MKLYPSLLFILNVYCASIVTGQDSKDKLPKAKPNLKVVSNLVDPYLMASKSSDGKKFEGFVVDVLDELAKLKNFEYDLETNDQYGHFDPDTKKWSGMIGDLVNRKADMVFADVTITPQRMKVVEFTYPFQTFELGAMYYESTETEHQIPGIMSSFPMKVWNYIIIMCCVYFVVLFLIGRISHRDWSVDNVKMGYKNELGFLNSFWFMASSLFLRTTHTTPRGLATRLLTVCFYFFSLFIIVLYISNLTVFLIALKSVGDTKPMHVTELLQDNGKQFAAIDGGSTQAFLRKSQVDTHQRIFESIPDSNFFANYSVAEQAMKENLNIVLVIEGPVLEYITNRQCSFKGSKIPETQRSYSIAVQSNSPYNQLISQGLVELENYGRLNSIYEKWWVLKNGKTCSTDHQRAPEKLYAQKLSISNIRSICMFLGIAIIVSIAVAIFEYCVRSAIISKGRKESLVGGIISRLRLMCTCRDRYSGSVPLQNNEDGINVQAV